MTTTATKVSLPQGVLAPRLLLLGVAVSFLACCGAGRLLSRVNCLRDFTRFHPCINYQNLYYPTVSQVRSLARDTLDPDKVVVVLGGNSILQGFGQGAEGNWTRHLQELLGDRFQVLNLALPNTIPFEFGATAAEVLTRDHPRLLLLSHFILPATLATVGDPDGAPHLCYFYWQARARGLLTDCPERDSRLRLLERERDESFREVKRQSELDASLGFNDLWNAFTYRCATTTWCPLLRSSWTRPRCSYADPDPTLPPADKSLLQRLAPSILSALRRVTATTRLFLPPSNRAADWHEPYSPLPSSVREAVPPALRGRTLMLLGHHCPYYLRLLTDEERELYARSFEVTARLFGRGGIRAAAVGQNLAAKYYADHIHLTAAGGRLLALEVAPMIRELARELGYLQPPTATAASRGTKP